MRGSDSRLPAAQSYAAPSHADQFLPARPLAPELRPAPGPARLQAEIVIPVRNEERDLAPSVRRLAAYLGGEREPFTAQITIADNGSTDGTWAQALTLMVELPVVRAVRLERPGRGGALRSVWSSSDAAVLAYMDVDLSTDLNALLPLLAPLVSGHSDVAIGTRLARGSRVVRGMRREVISRGYNLLLHAVLGTGFSDAQCGFKAIRADAARVLLPLTTDTGWFFDTELLVLAERAGLRIHEVPVDWIDDPDSRVKIIPLRWPTCGASPGWAPAWAGARSRYRRWAIPRVPACTCIPTACATAAGSWSASWRASSWSAWPAPWLTFCSICSCGA
jgi:glycosyl transferase family 2